jgi:flagellar hook-associated protein 2
VSSGITFSGFNNIDFNVVVNALMAQASQPLTTLQNKQTALKSQVNTFNSLSSRLAAIESAADDLSSSSSLTSFTSTVSDTSVLTASTSDDSAPGHYDIVVRELARAQVTASASTAPDSNSTAVAGGGWLTINGVQIDVQAPVTLVDLAKKINETTGIAARASVVQTGADAYRLVLTGVATGAANGFTVQNNLTGGSGVTFTDTDNDGTSGDSTSDNAVQATNAQLLVNNLEISSESNLVKNAVPGTTLSLLKQAPGSTIGLDVSANASGLSDKLDAFVTAYNALQKFSTDQNLAQAAGNGGSIARDPLFRTLRTELRNTVGNPYGNEAVKYLSQIGIEFTRSGTLQFNKTKFKSATDDGTSPLTRVIVGTSADAKDGAFAVLQRIVGQYTQASGMISKAKERLNKQVTSIDTQIASMQRRLDLQRATLLREYTAADVAMSQLKNQSGALASLGTSFGSSFGSSSNNT